jgi:hypothetical protein
MIFVNVTEFKVLTGFSATGKAIISGHADGSIVRYIFSDDSTGETQVFFDFRNFSDT